MLIRRLQPEDAQEVCKVHYAAVNALEGGPYGRDILDAWTGAVSPEAFRLGLLEGRIGGYASVIRGELAGFALMDGCFVRAVYIRPDHQRAGVASALLARLEEDALREGVSVFYLEASLNARKFYESKGFHVTKEGAFRLNEDMEMACLYMEKPLSSDG